MDIQSLFPALIFVAGTSVFLFVLSHKNRRIAELEKKLTNLISVAAVPDPPAVVEHDPAPQADTSPPINKTADAENPFRDGTGMFRSIADVVRNPLLVTDAVTDEVLYANPAFLRAHNLPDDTVSRGTTCFRMFAEECRCVPCAKAMIENQSGGNAVWEITQDGRRLQQEAFRVLLPHGRVAIVHLATDVTKLRQEENEARLRLTQNEMMSHIMRDFLRPGNKTGIADAIREVCVFFGCDHTRLCTVDANLSLFNVVAEWASDDLPPHVKPQKTPPYTLRGAEFFETVFVKEGRTHHTSGILETIAQGTGHYSTLTVPLFSDFAEHRTFSGFLQFSYAEDTHEWNQNTIHVARGFASILGNVMERDATERDLRLMSAVVENTDRITFFLNAEGTLVKANPAFFRLSGYTPEDLAAGDLTERVFNAKTVARLKAEVFPGVLQGKSHEADFAFYPKVGSQLRCRSLFFSIQQEDGTFWIACLLDN